jgi:ribonuclease P protein component
MLAKKNRIKRDELKELFRQAKKERTANFFLAFDFAKPQEASKENFPPKVGLIISKKVAKTAVERHLLKRKIANFLRESIISRLPENLKGVLHLQLGEEKLRNQDWKRELEQLFQPFFKK